MTIAFIDIGQGDATVIELPTEFEGILIDCGRTGITQVQSYLEVADIQRLRLVLLSHSDDDHVGGIMDVLDNYQGSVEEIAFNPDRLMGDSGEKRYRLFLMRLAQFLRARGCRASYPSYRDQWIFDSAVFTVLHPSGPDRLEALARNLRNDGSVLLLAEYDGARVLLAADLQGLGWQAVVQREGNLPADLLKLPHHGAWHTTGLLLDQILARVQPTLGVISVGNRNPYGHPSLETLQALQSYLNEHVDASVVCTQLAISPHPRITANGTIKVMIEEGRISRQ